MWGCKPSYFISPAHHFAFPIARPTLQGHTRRKAGCYVFFGMDDGRPARQTLHGFTVPVAWRTRPLRRGPLAKEILEWGEKSPNNAGRQRGCFPPLSLYFLTSH